MKNDIKNKIHSDYKKYAFSMPFNKVTMMLTNKMNESQLKKTPVPAGIKHTELEIKGHNNSKLIVDVYEPENNNEALPCIVDAHGGAFAYEPCVYHKILAYTYAKEANCRVFMPRYHLIPNYAYPVAYEDCLATYRYVCEHKQELKIDTDHIAIVGDSAGGALASVLCNTVEGKKLPKPCFQMLLYPVTDSRMVTKSMQECTNTPLWNSKSNAKMWKMYLKNATEEDKKLASPMANDLPSYMPTTYIETAEADCLHDEGVEYAEKLKKHGVDVSLFETKGTIHAFEIVMDSEITQTCVKRRIEYLNKAFGK